VHQAYALGGALAAVVRSGRNLGQWRDPQAPRKSPAEAGLSRLRNLFRRKGGLWQKGENEQSQSISFGIGIGSIPQPQKRKSPVLRLGNFIYWVACAIAISLIGMGFFAIAGMGPER
jgi:hypothetical protein